MSSNRAARLLLGVSIVVLLPRVALAGFPAPEAAGASTPRIPPSPETSLPALGLPGLGLAGSVSLPVTLITDGERAVDLAGWLARGAMLRGPIVELPLGEAELHALWIGEGASPSTGQPSAPGGGAWDLGLEGRFLDRRLSLSAEYAVTRSHAREGADGLATGRGYRLNADADLVRDRAIFGAMTSVSASFEHARVGPLLHSPTRAELESGLEWTEASAEAAWSGLSLASAFRIERDNLAEEPDRATVASRAFSADAELDLGRTRLVAHLPLAVLLSDTAVGVRVRREDQQETVDGVASGELTREVETFVRFDRSAFGLELSHGRASERETGDSSGLSRTRTTRIAARLPVGDTLLLEPRLRWDREHDARSGFTTRKRIYALEAELERLPRFLEGRARVEVARTIGAVTSERAFETQLEIGWRVPASTSGRDLRLSLEGDYRRESADGDDESSMSVMLRAELAWDGP
jgi:hypothetical protein